MSTELTRTDHSLEEDFALIVHEAKETLHLCLLPLEAGISTYLSIYQSIYTRLIYIVIEPTFML